MHNGRGCAGVQLGGHPRQHYLDENEAAEWRSQYEASQRFPCNDKMSMTTRRTNNAEIEKRTSRTVNSILRKLDNLPNLIVKMLQEKPNKASPKEHTEEVTNRDEEVKDLDFAFSKVSNNVKGTLGEGKQ
ncbi:hypothetical protein QQ045_033456 [Rhodiola kirilowii]